MADPPALLVAAVKAFHRAEREGAERIHAVLESDTPRPYNYPCSKIWKWALRRWGTA
jgi:hypothetical protein